MEAVMKRVKHLLLLSIPSTSVCCHCQSIQLVDTLSTGIDLVGPPLVTGLLQKAYDLVFLLLQ